MCYTKVKKLEKAPRQKVFYKVVSCTMKSIYTSVPLITGMPMKATNIRPHPQNGHSYRYDFVGWGVFARVQQANTYRNQSCVISHKIVRVRCKGNPRVANSGGVKCYLFDTITILDGGKPV